MYTIKASSWRKGVLQKEGRKELSCIDTKVNEETYAQPLFSFRLTVYLHKTHFGKKKRKKRAKVLTYFVFPFLKKNKRAFEWNTFWKEHPTQIIQRKETLPMPFLFFTATSYVDESTNIHTCTLWQLIIEKNCLHNQQNYRAISRLHFFRFHLW